MRMTIPMRSLTGLGFALAAGALSAQSVTVVNMIPASLSNETNCDGEPSIAVNPANLLQMAGTAFTPNPAGGSLAPYFVSTDGGNTWTLNAVMPGGTSTSDVSLRFGTSSNVLYAGILRRDNFNLNILRTGNFASTTPMSILVNRADDDQPFMDARTVSGLDRVYIGNNNFNGTGSQTATVDLSTNAATAAAPAGFAPTSIEKRATVSQDGPSVRCASAPDGRVYGAFLGWRSGSSTFISDVVVVRDDAGGTGATKFASLLGADGLAGVKVATGQSMTFNSKLGSNRAGSSLSIAVDPTDSLTVYVAWGTDGSGGWTLHLRRSTDGGATWSSDLRTIAGATNPALAINNAGQVGFFYQKLSSGSWINQAEFAPKNDPFTSPTTIVLATLVDGSTGTCGQPTIGDYSGMMSAGADFYGVFSGSNTPNTANFPNGVTFQRQANWSTRQLLGTNGTTVISTSIDPYFFHISGVGGPVAPAIVTQPSSQSVATGATATFSVTATGTAPLSYQWFKNGSAISGATSSAYTTPATTTSDNGSTFYVTVANSVSSVTSATATLTVSPVIGGTFTEVESNNSIATANAVGSSYTAIQGNLTAASDVDTFRLTLQAGQKLTINMTGPSGPDWDLYLKNAAGTTLASSLGSTTTEALNYTNSGSSAVAVYPQVIVYSGTSSTPYNLALTYVTPVTFNEVEANNSIAAANVVPDGATKIVGYIGATGDNDYFAVKVAAGRTLKVNMTGPTGSGYDYDLYFYNAAGTQLASGIGSTTTESVSWTNSGASTVTVYVAAKQYAGSSTTTPYNLAVTR